MPATPPCVVPDVAELVALGRSEGLDVVGVASAEPFDGTRHDLEERKARGLHGGMAFTYRSPERSTTPAVTVPGARSLVVGARSYWREGPAAEADAGAATAAGAGVVSDSGRPVGVVARYAWSDHYAPLRTGLGAIAARLRDHGWVARVVADDNALVDRAAAHRAGLGWFGKNANLLLPGQGSWFVLGSVITTAPLVDDEAGPVADGCGSCTRCLDACPTGAIVAPGVVDARRCLAWLVQAEGVFPREHRVALGGRIYGCDDCQEVCPPNRLAVRRRAVGVGAASGHVAAEDAALGHSACEEAASGHPASEEVASGHLESSVDLLDLLSASDAELLARHGRWYIPRRDPRYLRRNALVVLGNVASAQDPRVVEALLQALRDPDPLLRAHAVWAARRLGRDDLVADLASDSDPAVQSELRIPVEVRR